MPVTLTQRLARFALIALIPLAVIGGLRLRIEGDILATLPQRLPETQSLRTLREGFDGGSDLLITVQGQDEESAQSAAEAIGQALRGANEEVRDVRGGRPPTEEMADGAAMIAWALQNTNPMALARWQQSVQGDGANQKAKRAVEKLATAIDGESVPRLAYDPLGLLETLELGQADDMQGMFGGLRSADGTLQVLVVTPTRKIDNYRTATEWMEKIRARVGAAVAGKNVNVRYTGEPAFQSEIGSGVAADMSSTIGLTEILIALLFWIMFRMLKPLLWIQLLLMLSLGLALGLGGLFIGKISLMSLGFAAIVLGIITDYAVLIIQEAREHPAADTHTLRKLAAPGMLAGGATTAAVFLSLLLSGLPGLMELGALVALGVLTGLAVMLVCAPYFAARMPKPETALVREKRQPGHLPAIVTTAVLIAAIAGVFAWRGLPKFTTDADALRPTRSAAYDTWQLVQSSLGKDREASVPVMVSGKNPDQLLERARKLNAALQQAKQDGVIVRGAAPTLLVPDAFAQTTNRPMLQKLLGDRARLEQAIAAAGFNDDALALLRSVCACLEQDFNHAAPIAPGASAASAMLGKVLSTTQPERTLLLASVSVDGSPDHPNRERLAALQQRLQNVRGVEVASWELLGSALSAQVKEDLAIQLFPVVAIIVLTLWFTFRRARDLFLSLCMLATGLGALAATFAAFGVEWNLASLAAIPLLLGTGIEYGIHLLLALKRHGNDIAHVRATTGRAVFFSGMTTVIGFASLFFAGNKGVASLGMACCVGTLWILAILLGLLPHWRRWFGADAPEPVPVELTDQPQKLSKIHYHEAATFDPSAKPGSLKEKLKRK